MFLQSSDLLERVKKDKATINRWMFEMNFVPEQHKAVKFTIFDNGKPIFAKNLIGLGSRTWLKTTP